MKGPRTALCLARLFPLAVAAWLLCGADALLAGFPPATDPPYLAGFPVTLPGDFVRMGSVAMGDVDGDGLPDLAVGGSDGRVHVYDGFGTHLWSTPARDMAIEGKPAIGDVDGDGNAEVVFGTGSTFTPNGNGALYVYSHLGGFQCSFTPGPGPDGIHDAGIFSSPALADLDANDGGQLEIAFGAWDHRIRSIHHDCTLHWEVEARDTVFSSPAIADLDRDGRLEVVIGADSHFEPAPINTQDGGRLFVLNGENGSSTPGFPKQYDEVIVSAPTLGDLDGDGHLDIVVGTGNCWGANNGCASSFNPGVGEYVIAVDRFGNALPGWPRSIPGRIAESSPALVDFDGDGSLEVVVGAYVRTDPPPRTGVVYVFSASGATVSGWPRTPTTPADCSGGTVSYGTTASPVVADLTGDGSPEIVLPSNGELVVWDRFGTQLSRHDLGGPGCTPRPSGALVLGTNGSLAGSAAVGDVDGDGTAEVAIGGYAEFAQQPGALYVWDVAAAASPVRTWPQFRFGAENLGTRFVFGSGFEAASLVGWSAVSP